MSYKVKLICIKVIPIALFLLFFQTAKAQSRFSELDAELLANQKLLGNNVVAIIWKGDTVVYKKEMGDFNSKTAAPIASCSKWLTAALVMQFVDEGKLSLDDKVSRWLPEFEKYGKNYISIRTCLSHMTGIDDDANMLKKIFQRKKFDSLEDEVNSFASREIRANPGTDFWYGNIGINIAGRVLEVVSKKKFDILIKQKLFNPLGMRRTSFATLDGSAINPSGGASSTADDYIRFLGMLLNKGKIGNKQILSEESAMMLMQIQTKPEQIRFAPKAAQGYSYALGSWVLEEKDGKAEVMASPGLFGSWPMIDFCRGYACLIFVKSLLSEEKANLYIDIKKVIDEQMPSSCN